MSLFSAHLQLIPLLLVTNHQDGGYSLDDNELGVIFMVSAILELLFQVCLVHGIKLSLGTRKILKCLTLFQISTVSSVSQDNQADWVQKHI